MAKNDTKSGTNGNKGAQGKAPALPLFYSNPAPLHAQKHATLGLKANTSLDFARNVNAVPINMVEMPQVCHHYPIAFSPDEFATPVAILGLRDNENLFINEAAQWEEGKYIPAYVRRYPFILSQMPGDEKLSLCVDMASKSIADGAEQPFFGKDAKPSELSKKAIEFCSQYHAAAQQTIEFSKALAASGLLTERAAKINTPDGRQIKFSGFKVVDETKLSEMKDKDFLEWRKKGWLPFLYAHLFSNAQWHHLTYQLNKLMKQQAA